MIPILTSIDSKDPVVANAWLETLLDAIDLLPIEVIKQEIIVIAINKSQLSQPPTAAPPGGPEHTQAC